LFLQSSYKQENSLLEFDAETEAMRLKAETKTIRNKGYRRSRLDKYTAELITLRHQGVSIAELQVGQLLTRDKALETVSQEMGHFRPEITEAYLR
jgi:hypothetical protein